MTVPGTPVTFDGEDTENGEAVASWLTSFMPQAQTVPSDFSATLCQPPPAIPTTSTRLATYTGVSEPNGAAGLPIWPKTPPPHATTRPLERRARLWSTPPEIATASVIPLTWTGAARSVVVPSP